VAGGARVGLTLPPGSESTAMMHVTDWLPTLCEVAGCAGGGSPTGTKALDGVSAWGAIARNESSKRTEILHDTIETAYSPAMRVGDWKLLGPRSTKAERDTARHRGDPIVYVNSGSMFRLVLIIGFNYFRFPPLSPTPVRTVIRHLLWANEARHSTLPFSRTVMY